MLPLQNNMDSAPAEQASPENRPFRTHSIEGSRLQDLLAGQAGAGRIVGTINLPMEAPSPLRSPVPAERSTPVRKADEAAAPVSGTPSPAAQPRELAK